MDIGKVYLERHGFDGIFRSSYELLTTECVGNVFGHTSHKKSGDIWVIESALPIQRVRRTSKDICIGSDKVLHRSRLALSNVPIGDYHSHILFNEKKGKKIDTYLPVISLSEEDKEDLKEWGNNISLIMALKETPRITRLGNNPFLLTGHIRDNGSIYRIEIGAFYYNGRMRKALIKADKKVLDSIR